jgi:hypothetical protein
MRDTGARTEPGKQGVLHTEFLGERNIDVIGTLEICLEVVIAKGCDIRHGIIPSFKCDSPGIAGKRGVGQVELAGRTIPGQLHLSYHDRCGFTKHTGIRKLIP